MLAIGFDDRRWRRTFLSSDGLEVVAAAFLSLLLILDLAVPWCNPDRLRPGQSMFGCCPVGTCVLLNVPKSSITQLCPLTKVDLKSPNVFSANVPNRLGVACSMRNRSVLRELGWRIRALCSQFQRPCLTSKSPAAGQLRLWSHLSNAQFCTGCDRHPTRKIPL